MRRVTVRSLLTFGTPLALALATLACGAAPESEPARRCNGEAAYCERRYDQLVFPGTHNSHAAKEDHFGDANANQLYGVARQLEDGVRLLLMDVYDDEGETMLCHGPCGLLGATPHRDTLGQLKGFFERHPHDVVTIIYEDHVPAAKLAEDLAATGLDALSYTHPAGDPWPTLGQLIDRGARLVVTLESGGPPPAYLHHVWDLAFDTPYSFTSPEAMSCALNRGSASNDLFLLNHWVSNGAGLPHAPAAATVNQRAFLLERARRCAAETGHVPNFIAVDFYEQGELFDAVRELNQQPSP